MDDPICVDEHPGVLIRPDHQVAALRLIDGVAERGLTIKRSGSGPTASEQGLLHQTGGVDPGPRATALAVSAAHLPFRRRGQICIELEEVGQILGLGPVVGPDQGVHWQGVVRIGDPVGRRGARRGQKVALDMTDRAIPARPAPAKAVDLFQHVEELTEQDFGDHLARRIGDRREAEPTAPGLRRPVTLSRNQSLQGLFGQIGPGQQETRIEVG